MSCAATKGIDAQPLTLKVLFDWTPRAVSGDQAAVAASIALSFKGTKEQEIWQFLVSCQARGSPRDHQAYASFLFAPRPGGFRRSPSLLLLLLPPQNCPTPLENHPQRL